MNPAKLFEMDSNSGACTPILIKHLVESREKLIQCTQNLGEKKRNTKVHLNQNNLRKNNQKNQNHNQNIKNQSSQRKQKK